MSGVAKIPAGFALDSHHLFPPNDSKAYISLEHAVVDNLGIKDFVFRSGVPSLLSVIAVQYETASYPVETPNVGKFH